MGNLSFTKTDLGLALGCMVGIIVAKKYVRPVIQGAL